MTTTVYVALVALLASAIALEPAVAAPASRLSRSPAANVRYIANEGFLIEVGEHKVLIDAIFDDGTIDYADVPDEDTLERARGARAPFDEVDVMLVTHVHRDHFSPLPVSRFLESSPSTVLVAPPQAVDALMTVAPALADRGDRIRALDLETHAATEFQIGGVHVRAIRLRHSSYMVTDRQTGSRHDRHAEVENLAYLIDLNGVRAFHLGDALVSMNRPFFDETPPTAGGIDLVFITYFDATRDTRRILERWADPHQVVLMHFPPGEEAIERAQEQYRPVFPDAVVYHQPGRQRTLRATSSNDE